MSPLDTDYWLGHCQGFRVDAPEGHVGRVDDVLFGSQLERPDALLVRSGVLGNHLVSAPVGEVAEITPRSEQLMLRHRPDEVSRRVDDRSRLLPRLMAAARPLLAHAAAGRHSRHLRSHEKATPRR
jgi:hypothetical protein